MFHFVILIFIISTEECCNNKHPMAERLQISFEQGRAFPDVCQKHKTTNQQPAQKNETKTVDHALLGPKGSGGNH